MRQLFNVLIILGIVALALAGIVYMATVFQWAEPVQGEKVATIFGTAGIASLLGAYFLRMVHPSD